MDALTVFTPCRSMSVMVTDAGGSAALPPARDSRPEGEASRRLIAAAVVVTIVWIFAEALIRPRGFWLNVVLLGILVLLALVALVGSSLSLIRRGPQPAHFAVRKGVAFVVPASRRFGCYVAGEVLGLGVVVGIAINTLANPVDDQGTLSIIYSGL